MLAIVLIVVVAGAILYWSLFSPQKETTEYFTITFPQKLAVDTEMEFDDPDAVDAQSYEGINMRFDYAVYDLSALGVSENYQLSETEKELIITGFEEAMKSEFDDFKKKDSINNHLRFTCEDDGEAQYADLFLDFHGNKMYMFLAHCNASKEKTYVSKFARMYESLKYTD